VLPAVRWAHVCAGSESRISDHVTHPSTFSSFVLPLTSHFSLSSSLASPPSVFPHPRHQWVVAFPQTEHPRITRLVGGLANTHRPTQTAPFRLASPTALVSWARFGNLIADLERTMIYIGRFRTFSFFFFRPRLCSPFPDHYFHYHCPRA
jgi:hypothetical protein